MEDRSEPWKDQPKVCRIQSRNGSIALVFPSKKAQNVSIKISNIEGKVVNEIRGNVEPGLHRVNWNLALNAAPPQGAAGGRGTRSGTRERPDASTPSGNAPARSEEQQEEGDRSNDQEGAPSREAPTTGTRPSRDAVLRLKLVLRGSEVVLADLVQVQALGGPGGAAGGGPGANGTTVRTRRIRRNEDRFQRRLPGSACGRWQGNRFQVDRDRT